MCLTLRDMNQSEIMRRVPFIVSDRSVNFVTFHYGFGNRVVPVGCMLSLVAELGYRAVVFWGADVEVGKARFSDLFDTSDLPFKLIDGGYEAWVMCDDQQPRLRYINLLRRIIRKLPYSQFNIKLSVLSEHLDDHNIPLLMKRPATDFLKYRKILIKSFRAFRYNCDLSWLKPAPHIMPRIVELKKQFVPNTVGVHLRGTDAGARVPVKEYIIRMRAEVELDTEVKFFFSSDGDKDEKRIIELFGDRLIRTKPQAVRRTIQGQQDAVVDLFGLAGTARIIGPKFSTFSLTAAILGNRPFLRINSASSRTKTSHS